jgi:translation initiation factor IF-2
MQPRLSGHGACEQPGACGAPCTGAGGHTRPVRPADAQPQSMRPHGWAQERPPRRPAPAARAAAAPAGPAALCAASPGTPAGRSAPVAAGNVFEAPCDIARAPVPARRGGRARSRFGRDRGHPDHAPLAVPRTCRQHQQRDQGHREPHGGPHGAGQPGRGKWCGAAAARGPGFRVGGRGPGGPVGLTGMIAGGAGGGGCGSGRHRAPGAAGEGARGDTAAARPPRAATAWARTAGAARLALLVQIVTAAALLKRRWRPLPPPVSSRPSPAGRAPGHARPKTASEDRILQTGENRGLTGAKVCRW